MSDYTFTTLQAQLMRHYGRGEYAQALELLRQEGDNFPDEWRLYDWRMCMASRVNDTALALQAFKDALAHGFWFSPSLLRDDEDLVALQGAPEFEQMVTVCQQKLAEAEKSARPELLVVPPEGVAARPYPLLIALHGNMSNSGNTVSHMRPVCSRGWLLALPQSSQVMGPAAYGWHDFEKATHEVQEHYAALAKEYPIDAEKVIMSGFSMGGGLAIWLAVSRASKARGFVVLGPYLRDSDALKPYLESARAHGVRGYIVMGEQEAPAGQENVRRVAELLNTHGVPCELELRPDIGHAFPPDFEKSLEKAFEFILQG